MTSLVGNHPFVTIKVKLPKKNKWLNLNCLIDTGFSGGIALPENLKVHFPATTFIEARFLLADNSEITVDTTYTQVAYKKRRKEVSLVFMGENSEGLLGVEFLNQMRFCLDLKANIVELTF